LDFFNPQISIELIKRFGFVDFFALFLLSSSDHVWINAGLFAVFLNPLCQNVEAAAECRREAEDAGPFETRMGKTGDWDAGQVCFLNIFKSLNGVVNFQINKTAL